MGDGDISPCAGDGIIDVGDVLGAVDAFDGGDYCNCWIPDILSPILLSVSPDPALGVADNVGLLEIRGELDDPTRPLFPSGDGQPGGSAVLRIDVLQADANGDDVVDATDGQLISDALGTCAGDTGFDISADVNRDGCVDAADDAIFQAGLGGSLPSMDGQGAHIVTRMPDINEVVRAYDLADVVVDFNEPIDATSIAPGTLAVVLPDGTVRDADTLVLTNADTTATFTFAPPLDQLGSHAFQLSAAIADTSGQLLAVDTQRAWSTHLDYDLTTLAGASPADGESGVAVTRETILTFRNALDPIAVVPAAFNATFGGNPLTVGNLHLSSDGKRVTLFYQNPLPASALVRVEVDGDQLLDDLGNVIDGDANGAPGGIATIDFETLSLTTIPGTAVCGRVFASELSGVNEPLQGVVISVDGLESTLFATTDTKGDYCLDPAPVGRFFVHVNELAATNASPPPARTIRLSGARSCRWLDRSSTSARCTCHWWLTARFNR